MLAPLGVVVVAIAIGAMSALRSRTRSRITAAEIFLPSLPFVLIWVFVIFPPVSSLGFRALAPCECFDFDVPPPGTGEEKVCFLSTDRNVICEPSSLGYRAPFPVRAAAGATVAIWAGCAPLLYGWLLYAARMPLTRRTPPTALSDTLELFLADGFRPQYFWWEMVNVLRKLLLTGFLALVSPGSFLQIFIAVVIGLIVVAVEMYIRPCDTQVRTFLSLTTGLALVLTLQGTLAFKISQGGSLSAGLVLAVLIPAALVVVLIFVAILLANLADERRVVVARLTAPPHLVVAPRQLERSKYHCIISHQWGTGQDQANALKARLQALAPGLRCFLDVEDLEDTSRLEEYVRASDVFIGFLSGSADATLSSAVPVSSFSAADVLRSDYFRSANCVREISAAAAATKQICFVMEIDKRHGAVPLEIHRRDCPEKLRQLFDVNPIVPWFRAVQFQLLTLRLILQRVLGTLAGELYIPGHILHKMEPMLPPAPPAVFHLHVSCNNPGATEVAALLASEAERIGGAPLLTTDMPDHQHLAVRTLLYLSADLDDSWPRLQVQVEDALRRGGPSSLLLLHEQRGGCGAAPFDAIIERTPERLKELGVFRTTALPLTESPAVRVDGTMMDECITVSLRLALQVLCGGSADAATGRKTSPPSLERLGNIPLGRGGTFQALLAGVSRRARVLRLRFAGRSQVVDDSGELALTDLSNASLRVGGAEPSDEPVAKGPVGKQVAEHSSCFDLLPFSPSVRSSQQLVLPPVDSVSSSERRSNSGDAAAASIEAGGSGRH
jgi:hypothetical protein